MASGAEKVTVRLDAEMVARAGAEHLNLSLRNQDYTSDDDEFFTVNVPTRIGSPARRASPRRPRNDETPP